MKGKKKKVVGAGSKAPKAGKQAAKKAAKEERRAAKMELRRREKRLITRDMWALPAPADLVGTLEKPTRKSKYHSYFEFAENTEKKDKKLEFQVTNDPTPPPGFKFVPIGDPTLTNACKELSRARDAMIFIVSGSREEHSKVSAHMFRIGYHFRESIVDEASEIVGETAVSNRTYNPNEVEPIPESQEEINKQADGAIRDLFPRIPNTDRQMVIDHAFRKGALFHGEPTVGLQPTIPLSRRVQLAVLAHIRHTHTRYDLLLRETTWINARKVVEPICLDVLVKWRGDEETGRDQMEEILREVVVITDSEESDDSSDEDDSSEEEEEEEEEEEKEGEVSSASSASISQPNSRNHHRSAQLLSEALELQGISASANTPAKDHAIVPRDKKAQRGFKRYQAAWNDALTRQQENHRFPEARRGGTAMEGPSSRIPRSGVASPYYETPQYTSQVISKPTLSNAPCGAVRDEPRYYDGSHSITRQDPYYTQQQGPAPARNSHREEVILRPASERPTYYQNAPHHGTPYTTREQALPVVARGSPTSHGLQDMLVPSIETASSDAVVDSPRQDRRYEIYDGQQDSYPRRFVERVVERRKQSPAPHQVVVINDDSPQIKRRRVVYEDDYGHFRPLPPHDHDFYSTAPRADSHLLPASSVQRDFLVLHERPSPSSQGLFRDEQPSLTGPVGKRIPIYDSAPDSSYFASVPDRYRRVEVNAIHRDDPLIKRHMDSPQRYFENPGESSHRPVNGDMRIVENDRAIQAAPESYSRNPVQRRSSPPFPISSRSTRVNEMGPDPPRDGYQAFLNNFSQSQLEPPLLRARDGFADPSLYENSASQVNTQPRYEDRPSGSFTTLRPGEASSPVRYVERPKRIQEERRPMFYGDGLPATERYHVVDKPPQMREYSRPPPEGNSPTYVRTVRRPLIVLE